MAAAAAAVPPLSREFALNKECQLIADVPKVAVMLRKVMNKPY